ncbi:GNAT family N-acetyltransferase [Trichocoleus sp. FACHB-591]|uniref:GNAT family N-acetyltransferase n=1 Tax=Trichocoleus sp. FACHB-591 TaxID=2692872 RepID=UPI00168A26C1|nr:GNAT family N-acetyltransferase [Trichocoleus sp. FACHB-591]MBD2094662.1 GNAT family N-acetyltransferase [Trichocoleus sp. FACHB-591]
MQIEHLEFKPIDLAKHADVCVAFREDSYVCSFGSAELFHGADGKGAERYVNWLCEKMKRFPGGCIHVWSGSEIIGQMEMGRFRSDASLGYVNLYYVTARWRGTGVASLLDEYATAFFKRLSLHSARLSVTPTNTRAVEFYLRHGWKDLGPRENAPEVHYMGKNYA